MKKLKAAQLLLDRVGIGPVLKVEHSGSISNDLLVERMTDEEIAAVDAVMSKVLARVQVELDLEKQQRTHVERGES
jgi:ribosomal protein S13